MTKQDYINKLNQVLIQYKTLNGLTRINYKIDVGELYDTIEYWEYDHKINKLI